MPPLRPIVYGILALICFALDIAGVTTNIVKYESTVRTSLTTFVTVKVESTIWKRCVEVGGSKTCQDITSNEDCVMQRIRTLRAFGIMSIIVAFIGGLGLAAVDFLGKLPVGTDKIILAAVAFVLFVFQLIYWAIVAGLWNEGCGDARAFKELPNSDYGPSGPLFIASWVMSILMIAAAFLLRGPAREVTEVAAKTEPRTSEPVEPVSATDQPVVA